MKRYLRVITAISTIFLSSLCIAAPVQYTVDPNHSFVVWKINHLGFSNQTGKWPATGMIVLDQENPAQSHVDITVNIKSLVTGNSELNKHLEAEMFFDANKYPKATFVSNKVDVTGKDTAKVTGTLTLRGVPQTVTLDVKLNKIGESPINKKMTAGFTATAQIKRSDFGINAFIPAVSDAVTLDIDAEAQKQ